MKKIIIGARGSKLSLVYVSKVKSLILKNYKDIEIQVKTIKTSGDIHENTKISEIGGKNLFCKEIEDNLLNKNIDIAIHALKDMESIAHKDLTIGAYIKRNDPRDILVSNKIKKLSDLNSKVTIGSSSRRRELQLKKISKKIIVEDIRGNIDSRIKKLEEKNFDGIMLAAAGVKSLNLENKIGLIFKSEEVLPAAGQGIIAVQCRNNDYFILDLIKKINDKNTSLCALAEREMLKALGGDCETAVGGLAEISNNNLKLKAQLFSDSGDESFSYEMTGPENDALMIGKLVGQKLLDLAGDKFKKK
jgi:hydroxymethylbilane synthase